MRRGDFAEAWRVCDAVLAARRGCDCRAWPRHLQYVWNGSPVDGRRVLVRCYHGLGDTIQFVRLLAPLRARARRVTLWVQPALIDLLRDIRGADELLPLHDGAPAADYDVDIELMELPHLLRLSEGDLPGEIPYIHVRAGRGESRAARREIHDGARRIGLCWRAGEWNADRSIQADALHPLADLKGVRWFSLQYPPLSPSFELAELACRDIRGLAVRMQTLDLVISVDTMVADLAGALGLPVWTLLAADCDWRWMSDRADSPWYPTMRLFRQRCAGAWREVVADLIRALAEPRKIADSESRRETPQRRIAT